MPEPNPDQVTGTPREDGAGDTLPGPGSPGPGAPSSRPLGLESFTIPPAALEVAEKREGAGMDWADSSVCERAMVEGEPPRSSRNEDYGVDEARRRGFLSAARLARRRYTLLILLVLVFGILLIVAAAVSRSIEVQRPSSEGVPGRVRSPEDTSVVEKTPLVFGASEGASEGAAQPLGASGSVAVVAGSPPAPSAAPSHPPGEASAPVRPGSKSPQRPAKSREFLYEDGYRDSRP